MAWKKDRIVELLLEAGEIAARVKESMHFELKPDRSIVTPADREIERLLTSRLEDTASGSYLIGEETVEEKGEGYISDAFRGEAYIVDPIDGTAPFAHLLPNWGISIGRMEAGSLTDGAVYLPDFGEIVISEGNQVLQGSVRRGRWDWRELGPPETALNAYGLIAITQDIAKRGRVDLPNPVMVLGAAVVPMVGLLQGRFVGYLGSVKLWDIAGALPLILRKGLSVTVLPGGERREVTQRVEESTYHLDPGSPKRWSLRSDLLICNTGDEARMRGSFHGGERTRKEEP